MILFLHERIDINRRVFDPANAWLFGVASSAVCERSRVRRGVAVFTSRVSLTFRRTDECLANRRDEDFIEWVHKGQPLCLIGDSSTGKSPPAHRAWHRSGDEGPPRSAMPWPPSWSTSSSRPPTTVSSQRASPATAASTCYALAPRLAATPRPRYLQCRPCAQLASSSVKGRFTIVDPLLSPGEWLRLA